MPPSPTLQKLQEARNIPLIFISDLENIKRNIFAFFFIIFLKHSKIILDVQIILNSHLICVLSKAFLGMTCLLLLSSLELIMLRSVFVCAPFMIIFLVFFTCTAFPNVFSKGCVACVCIGKGGSGDTGYIITAHLTLSPQRGVSVNAVHTNNNKECTYSLLVYLTDIIHRYRTSAGTCFLS